MKNQIQNQNTASNPKSGQKVARKISRANENFWLSKVFLAKKKDKITGKVYLSGTYYIRLQHGGSRQLFALGESDKLEAAKKAKELFCLIHSADDGWQKTQEKYGKVMIVRKDDPTLGEYLQAAHDCGIWNAGTFRVYSAKLRRVAAEVFDLNHPRNGNRHAARNGGRKQWVEAVDKIHVRELNDDAVRLWRTNYLDRRGTDPVALRKAQHTVDSLVRNCKTLFGKRAEEELSTRIRFPNPIPFRSIRPKTKGLSSFRYRSRIDPIALLQAAREELREQWPERYKIFLMALGAGLRRMEIDRLLWSSVLEKESVLRIEEHKFFSAKSVFSEADVAVEKELIAELIELRKPAGPRPPQEDFVIHVEPRFKANGDYVNFSDNYSYRFYRAASEFSSLCEWLRSKGVNEESPIHTLRKEYGRLLTEGYGIYAASKALRHSSVAVTAAFYADETRRIVPSLIGRKSAIQNPLEVTQLSPQGRTVAA